MTKILQSCRQGFSLLEVLVSVFVVLIGLLGVATMIPAGRFELLQARKADMGADLSRAVMNSVITQISNGWTPPPLDSNQIGYYIVANDNGALANRLVTGFNSNNFKILARYSQVYNDRMFNGDDDMILMEGDNNQLQLALDNAGKVIGSGVYTAFATIVPLDNGYYEVTGLAIYRYSEATGGSAGTDATDYQRGSYVFTTDNTGKYRWYKIENVYKAPNGQAMISTSVGERTSVNSKYLGEVIGICKKVVRLDDSYTTN